MKKIRLFHVLLILISGIFFGANVQAGVSCGSDEWCCKHDIGGTGECTKCCPKAIPGNKGEQASLACVESKSSKKEAKASTPSSTTTANTPNH